MIRAGGVLVQPITRPATVLEPVWMRRACGVAVGIRTTCRHSQPATTQWMDVSLPAVLPTLLGPSHMITGGT